MGKYPMSEFRKKSQVTIPKEIVDQFNLEEGDKLEFIPEKDGIKIRPVVTIPKSQLFFWTERWQEGEKEADEDNGIIIRNIDEYDKLYNNSIILRRTANSSKNKKGHEPMWLIALRHFIKLNGAEGGIRTRTGKTPTAPSTLRVCQFRHLGITISIITGYIISVNSEIKIKN